MNCNRIRRVIGAMTGTSLDGIDVALVEIAGSALDLRATPIRHVHEPLGDLGPALRNIAQGEPFDTGEVSQLGWKLGLLHVRVIERCLSNNESIDLIAVHGQTVFHQPPLSWQLINSAPIGLRFNCPVVCDLRAADLTAGGQGAPITPIADWILFRHETERKAIVNLGGFCNVTILPPINEADELAHIRGFDVCVCNQLLNRIATRYLKLPYDDSGRFARTGRINPSAYESFLHVLRDQANAQRSLGSADQDMTLLLARLETSDSISGADIAASAVATIAQCIAESISDQRVNRIIVAGGGTHHSLLMEQIELATSVQVVRSSEHSIAVDAREAICMAVLGALCADQVPITLPQVTGCRSPAPIAGVWTNPHQHHSP